MKEEIKSEGGNYIIASTYSSIKKNKPGIFERHKKDSGFVTHPSNKDLVQSDGGGACP